MSDRLSRQPESGQAPEVVGKTRDRVPLDPAKMMLLFNASKALASTVDLDHLLQVIVSEVQTVLECDGAGVLLYDPDRDDFFWRIVQDRERLLSSAHKAIRIPKDRGVCGWVFETHLRQFEKLS
jgi:GAF domain-containing protein